VPGLDGHNQVLLKLTLANDRKKVYFRAISLNLGFQTGTINTLKNIGAGFKKLCLDVLN